MSSSKLPGSEIQASYSIKIQIIKYLFQFDIAEPVGSKAPTFSTDANSISFTRNVDQSFGLLCQAQAYPAPLFRQVFNDY